jgi:hypothetical protein
MRKYLIIILILFAAAPAWGAGPVWPGLYGHGTDWQLQDKPGSGTPIIYIINSLSNGVAGNCDDTDYNSTGNTVCKGTAQYVFESAANVDGSSNPNGKIILAGIDGTYNEADGDIWYLENNDWTIVDLDPPGITTGLLWRNIKFEALSSNRELTHFFIKDFRGYHGAGANGVDGGTIDTTTGTGNRKPMSIYAGTSGDVLTDIVLYKSIFGLGLDGSLGIGGEAGIVNAERITVADCVIAQAIAYGAMGVWDSGTTYAKWALVEHASHDGYYESVQASNTNHEPPDVTWWREIDNDQTDRNVDSWKGLTSEGIDDASFIRNIFAFNSQRNLLYQQSATGNIDNNLIFDAKSYGTYINGSKNGSNENVIKLALVGNVAIGGPDSGTYTDEWFPNLYVPTAGWYGTLVDSNNNAMSSIDSTHFTDSSKSWDVDGLIGYVVRIISDTGNGQDYKLISDNTSDTITIAEAWDTTPDGTSDYEILDLSGHDIYVADTKMIECDATPCATEGNYTVKQQDSLTDCGSNIYDWDCVDNREEIPEAMIKHTSVPTGSHVSGHTPIDDDDVESTLLAQDGTGAGAYNDNQDTLTAAIFTDIAARTNSNAGYLTSVVDGDFPTISSSGEVLLDIPTDSTGTCDDGSYRIIYWLQNGTIEGCTAAAEEDTTSLSGFGGSGASGF